MADLRVLGVLRLTDNIRRHVSTLEPARGSALPPVVAPNRRVAGQFVTMACFVGSSVLWNERNHQVRPSALDILRGEPSIVIAPNHPSLLDAVLVISRLPKVVCIMKAKIWDNPLLGAGARLSGYIRNDSPVSMIKLAAKELEAGHQLLVFPEGTRTVNKPINPFKGGFAVIAKSRRTCAGGIYRRQFTLSRQGHGHYSKNPSFH
jgi:1-acyl-sn-glycerol-3-phosphate acyltransferase